MTKLIIAILLFAAPAFAQSAPPQPTFAISTLACVWRGAGTTAACTDAIGTLAVSPNFAVRYDGFLAPTEGLAAHTFGLQYGRTLDQFFKNPTTAFKPSNWRMYANAGIGAITAPSPSHFAATFGGGLSYDIAGDKTFSWNAIQAEALVGKVVLSSGRSTQLSWHLSTGLKINF